jgi:hypothetical protein
VDEVAGRSTRVVVAETVRRAAGVKWRRFSQVPIQHNVVVAYWVLPNSSTNSNRLQSE